MITVIRLRGTLKIVIKLEEFIINSFEKLLHIKNASLGMKKLCQVSSPKFKLPANGDEMKDDASLVVKNMAELTKFPFRNIFYSVETFCHENKSAGYLPENLSQKMQRKPAMAVKKVLLYLQEKGFETGDTTYEQRFLSTSRNSPRKGTCKIYKT